MGIKIISKQAYDRFIVDCDLASFTHLENWGVFKQYTNWDMELLGYQKVDELVGVAQVLYKRVPHTNFKIAYSSGGYLLSDKSEEANFNQSMFKYLKKKKCILYKIDPRLEIEKPVCHNLEQLSENSDSYILELNRLGYKHLGFYNEFEGMQPRHTIQIDTTNSYQEILNNMTNHTQRNIKTAKKYQCLSIVEGGLELLPEFHKLLTITAARDKFSIRDISYFENLIKTLKDEVSLTMILVDLNQLLTELEGVKKVVEKQIESLLKKSSYSPKYLENLKVQAYANSSRISEVSALKACNGQFVYIAGNLSISDQKRAWYLYGASSDSLKFLRGVYLLMNERIEDAVANGYDYYDLYGVSGIFDEEHPDYGLYQFKNGFGGKLIEYVGEFDKPLNAPMYLLFNKVYPCLKTIRKKRARANKKT